MLHSRLVAPIVLARVHNATRLLYRELYTITDTLIGLFLCKRYRTPDRLTNGQLSGYARKNILEILFLARIDILQRTARRALAGIDSLRKIREWTVENLLKLAALALPDAQIDTKKCTILADSTFVPMFLHTAHSNNIVACAETLYKRKC